MIHLKAILFGLALASPPVAAWVLRADEQHPSATSGAKVASLPQEPAGTAGSSSTKVAVEIVANGSEPKWIFVDTPVQSIPEPDVLPFAALATALLLLRRKRPGTPG